MTPIFKATGWVVGLAKGRYIVDGVAQDYTKDWNGPLSADWFRGPWITETEIFGVPVFRTRREARAAFASEHREGTPYYNAGRTRKVTVEIRTT